MAEMAAVTMIVDAAEESALVAKLKAGDATAFERLVRGYGGAMLAVIRRMLRQDDDAHDALQEAFTSAFKAIGRFEGQSRLSTWLHRIAVNAALMKLRQKRSGHEVSIESLLPRFLDDGHQAEPAQPWDRRAADPAERSELRGIVREAIDSLPENYRNVLLLRDIEELDTQQTADMLGIEPNAVKVRLHRARQALRTLLDRRFHSEPPC